MRWYQENRAWWEPLKRPSDGRAARRQAGPMTPVAGHRRRAACSAGTCVAALTAAGEDVTGLTRRDLDVTDAAAVPRRVAGAGPTSSSTARRGPRSTTPRRTRTRRSRSTGRARRTWPRRARQAGRRGWCTCPPTTCSPGTPRRPYAEDDATGAAHRLRAHQAGRRAGRARGCCRRRLRGADRLALRRARAQLRRAR